MLSAVMQAGILRGHPVARFSHTSGGIASDVRGKRAGIVSKFARLAERKCLRALT